jgi:RsiW-degrading membrane proteinase PrsW (M82 family)
MTVPLVTAALLAVAPVLGFLALLVLLDSYKLVSLAWIVALIGVGVLAAGLSYEVNALSIARLGMDLPSYSRYVAPVVEEAFKGAIVVWLLRRHRIAFLVDAAITGFALGSGFALVENAYALWRLAADAGATTWVVRGFGTAIMHGGATAAFAVISLAVVERHERHGLFALLPGFAAAVLLHSAFNHLGHAPVLATTVVLIAVPTLLLLAYHHGERVLGDWLGHGFDADAEMIELIGSGGLAASPTGAYLSSLKARFHGTVVADLLCYLKLFTELSLRAKGILMMRENGFEPEIDAETRGRFDELGYLERAIGPTGLMALQPLLPMRRKALRALYLL